MNYIFTIFKVLIFTTIIATGYSSHCYAQQYLNKQISITVNRQPVSEVLKTISNQGNFYFSYNSDIIPGDSIVTISIQKKSVRQVLDVLLKGTFQYKETGNYIIIQRAPVEKFLYISGQIADAETGKEVDYASVYSKTSLASALTDDNGNFRLRLRERNFPFSISVSKIGYADTSIVIHAEFYQDLKIIISPRAIDLDEVLVNYSAGERSWLTRLFVSSRLRAQSRNISRFFVSLPYQASLTPGLGTHGRMSGQVINKFSLNVLGGYTAGVNGVEIAGWFNISKKSVRYVQIAGIFNVVSENVNGVQLAGFHNHVLDSLTGVQVSGFGNVTSQHVSGVQVSGFFNQTASLKGAQIAGGINITRNNLSGAQISGIANVGGKRVSGVQIGPFNYAKNLKGAQIGVINIADSTSGYSIGIINIIKHGKSEISLYANEIVPFNIAWKTGSKKFYTILLAGSAISQHKKAYTVGLGLGKDFHLSDKIGIITEITNQTIYAGTWENSPTLNRLQTALNLKLGKKISLSAGPSFSVMNTKQSTAAKDYQMFPPKTYATFDLGKKASSWLGWQVGLSWQYGRL